jgi:hypothetical protein
MFARNHLFTPLYEVKESKFELQIPWPAVFLKMPALFIFTRQNKLYCTVKGLLNFSIDPANLFSLYVEAYDGNVGG